jgi:cholesterol transport system auxiliary component
LARRQTLRAGRGAAILLAVTLAGCTTLIQGAPSSIYDLTAPGEPSATHGQAQVLVPEPTMVRALDTDRIAARPSPAEYAYLPGAVWSDRLPKLLQARLVETLQNSGRARAVGVPGQGILVDFQLVLEVRAFELTQEGAVADFVAKVMDDTNGRVVGTRSFRHVVPVSVRGNGAIVQALDQAMDQAFVEIANWALR